MYRGVVERICQGARLKKLRIAFYLLLEGYFSKADSFWKAFPDTATENVLGEKIRRNTYGKYRNLPEFNDFVQGWRLWRDKNMLPFPPGRAWTDQPAHVIDIFFAFDDMWATKQERERKLRELQSRFIPRGR